MVEKKDFLDVCLGVGGASMLTLSLKILSNIRGALL